ncbi:hypothetical protein Anapl_10209 [Anas platyrhynchos]|uniref:Uncharacterized protein n=1 Tax=Anas platyrhynchos TaxID=8839 RepID=R0LT09_ANAPL|nr:hypothetical protein Anapl_10209 [Anas platyrhynchos]
MEGEALRLRWWTRQDPTGQHRGRPLGRRHRTPLKPRKSVLVVPNPRVCRGGEAVGNPYSADNDVLAVLPLRVFAHTAEIDAAAALMLPTSSRIPASQRAVRRSPSTLNTKASELLSSQSNVLGDLRTASGAGVEAARFHKSSFCGTLAEQQAETRRTKASKRLLFGQLPLFLYTKGYV